jgi:hypothetical protein
MILQKNWNLFSVNVAMAGTGLYQLSRKIRFVMNPSRCLTFYYCLARKSRTSNDLCPIAFAGKTTFLMRRNLPSRLKDDDEREAAALCEG